MDGLEPTPSLSTPFSFGRRFSLKKWGVVFFSLITILILVVTRAPSTFPQKSMMVVRENANISEVGQYLKDQKVIVSPTVFKWIVRVMNPQNGVLAGTYYFDEPANLFTVAYRISHGKFNLSPIVFRVPEGMNVFQIAKIADSTFPNFDKEEFLKIASKEEGYLFPETYHFLPTASVREIVETMRKLFESKIETIGVDIRNFGRPLDQVVKMASYLEEEARLMQTRRIVAGILWKRLDLGMPLQIDASFQYVNGKNTYELTLDDLKVDSPYNTYFYKGLTPTPISNPGLDSILAAVTPIKSNYFFFLSDKEGVMHYAATHDEHVANKNKYLK